MIRHVLCHGGGHGRVLMDHVVGFPLVVRRYGIGSGRVVAVTTDAEPSWAVDAGRTTDGPGMGSAEMPGRGPGAVPP